MLGTILTSLQNLISTSFVAGIFFPCLTFWFAQVATLYALNPAFARYVEKNINATNATIAMTGGLIGVALFAYAFSALLPALQAFLEGGNWAQWIEQFFIPTQMRRLEWLDEQEAENRKLRGSFRIGTGGQSQVEAWQKTLGDARVAGNQVAANKYTLEAASAKRVMKLSRRRRKGAKVLRDDLNAAVVAFALDLRANNSAVAGPQDDAKNHALTQIFDLLWTLTEYAGEYALLEYRRLKTTRAFGFGATPLAPTRMGNIAKSIRQYAARRYNFNLELFWSRLQFPVQRDKDFGPLLQAAKTKLDFLVSSTVLTLAWGAVWTGWLWLSGGRKSVFLVAAIGGPALSYVWYRVGVAHYQTFADLLRSSIDLFRLDLLTALHFPPPDGVVQERELWDTLDALTALYEIRDLRLSPPKS